MNSNHPDPARSGQQKAFLTRVQDILLRPKETWPEIDGEDGNPATIYRNWVLILAAIPAIAGFIGASLIGVSGFGMRIRVPIASGIFSMVISYALSLVMVYAVAWIANALAPRFQARQDMGSALKLIAYGATAGMVGGIFSIFPILSILGLLAGLYSIYLVYTGIPVLMKAPRERATGYTALLVVCTIGVGLVISLLNMAITPRSVSDPAAVITGQSGEPSVNIRIPGTDITIDSKRIEEAGRQLEQAKEDKDDEAAARAVGNLLKSAMGSSASAAFSAQQLRAPVPDTFGGLKRTSIEAKTEQLLGFELTRVHATYEEDGRHRELTIEDAGASPSAAIAMADWARTTSEKETDTEVERVYRKDGTAYKESWRKDGTRANLSLLLPNRILIKASGTVSRDELGQALQPIVQQLAALERAAD